MMTGGDVRCRRPEIIAIMVDAYLLQRREAISLQSVEEPGPQFPVALIQLIATGAKKAGERCQRQEYAPYLGSAHDRPSSGHMSSSNATWGASGVIKWAGGGACARRMSKSYGETRNEVITVQSSSSRIEILGNIGKTSRSHFSIAPPVSLRIFLPWTWANASRVGRPHLASNFRNVTRGSLKAKQFQPT